MALCRCCSTDYVADETQWLPCSICNEMVCQSCATMPDTEVVCKDCRQAPACPSCGSQHIDLRSRCSFADPETGYRDLEEYCLCLSCGAKFEDENGDQL